MSFASRSVTEHLLRGALGIGALATAAFVPLPAALGLLVLGLVALRGCPMCWTMGLIETVYARWTGRRPPLGACLDGACAAPLTRR